jgi:hypothetical protein
MVAAIGAGEVFSKGRDFAAWLGLVHKQISTGDRTILGKISNRGNRYLRVLFVQAAWVVLIKPMSWDRNGLKRWIEAAKKRLHRNVLAIALANKLARIAWGVLAGGRMLPSPSITKEFTAHGDASLPQRLAQRQCHLCIGKIDAFQLCREMVQEIVALMGRDQGYRLHHQLELAVAQRKHTGSLIIDCREGNEFTAREGVDLQRGATGVGARRRDHRLSGKATAPMPLSLTERTHR